MLAVRYVIYIYIYVVSRLRVKCRTAVSLAWHKYKDRGSEQHAIAAYEDRREKAPIILIRTRDKASVCRHALTTHTPLKKDLKGLLEVMAQKPWTAQQFVSACMWFTYCVRSET
jgi:hypothetical protein